MIIYVEKPKLRQKTVLEQLKKKKTQNPKAATKSTLETNKHVYIVRF